MTIGTNGNDVFQAGMGPQIFDGLGGSDTVSYAGSPTGIYANLSTRTATPLYRIMPFGDSITYGVVSFSNEESGGYRPLLWNKLASSDLAIDYVGALTNGPSSLPDRSHQGLRGKSIDYLNANDAAFLSAQQPDVVLLMIGTNDLATSSAAEMIADLRSLLISITDNQPNATVFVATIPPTHNASRNLIATAYNDAIPGIVADLDDTRNIRFVDMRNLTLADVSAPPVDSGVHPTSGGYEKIATNWHNALLASGLFEDERDSFTSIENLTGSARSDQLVGDAGNNVLTGFAGNDWLLGNGGNDVLDGGTGADRMEGGLGNDTYIVDNVGDVVIEPYNGGIDTVLATVSFTLGENVNNLTLQGAGALSGAGNEYSNIIIGNSGDNNLRGFGGDDILEGGGGNDTIEGGTGDDIAT